MTLVLVGIGKSWLPLRVRNSKYGEGTRFVFINEGYRPCLVDQIPSLLSI